MTEPGYALKAEPAKRLLRVAMSGYWDVDMLRRYAADRAAAVQALVASGITEADLRVLVDRRSQPVQSREVTAGLAEMLAEVEPRTGRTAVLVGSTLQRLQVARTSRTDRTRMFVDEPEALAWLLDDAPKDLA